MIIDRSFGGQNQKTYKKGGADPSLKLLYGNDCNLLKNLSKISKLANFSRFKLSDKLVGKYKIAKFPIGNFITHFIKISVKFDYKCISI